MSAAYGMKTILRSLFPGPGFFDLGQRDRIDVNRKLHLGTAANIALSDCRICCEERLPRPLPSSSTPELRSS